MFVRASAAVRGKIIDGNTDDAGIVCLSRDDIPDAGTGDDHEPIFRIIGSATIPLRIPP